MRTLQVSLGARSYPIHIGPGARDILRRVIGSLPGVHRLVIVTDQHVADLHLDKLQAAVKPEPVVLRVPPGETSKSLSVASGLYDRLADARVARSDLVIAFGGGVPGDLGGFVAATWLRGIRFIQVPTTLEAAVDASVGGKTGVNHRCGKNLIGAFHQPSAVVIDTDFLETLPQRDFVTGLGESVKHALIRDESFLSWHETGAEAIVAREPTAVSELIARNCAIKAEVVGQDEREQGLRAILNFGHTIGHALEHLLGYELRHGECVGLGMIAANQLACARGELAQPTADRAAALLGRLGLPVRLPRAIDPQEVLAVCRMDKKVRAGALHFVLIRAPGEALCVMDVTDAEIVGAVAALQP